MKIGGQISIVMFIHLLYFPHILYLITLDFVELLTAITNNKKFNDPWRNIGSLGINILSHHSDVWGLYHWILERLKVKSKFQVKEK